MFYSIILIQAMQDKIIKLKNILSQANNQQEEKIDFMNPVSKKTFDALPKIYGHRKKNKYLFKSIFQSKIKAIQLPIKDSKQQEHIQKPADARKIQGENNQGVSDLPTRRFKTQMRVHNKQYAKKLSKPKQQHCNRRYCFCHKQHSNKNHKSQSQSHQKRKMKSLNIKVPPIEKALYPDDIQSMHKVMNFSTQKVHSHQQHTRQFTLLDLLRSNHRMNNFNTNTIDNDERRPNARQPVHYQTIDHPQLVPKLTINTKNDVQVQTESLQIENDDDVKQRYILPVNKYKSLTERVDKDQRYKEETPRIQSLESQEDQQQREQIQERQLSMDIFAEERLRLQVLRKRYEIDHDNLDSDNESVTSSISSSSMSKYLFQNAKKHNTIFHTLNKKESQSSLNKQEKISQNRSNKEELLESKSVHHKKNKLFIIPQEEEYVDYLKSYKPMNHHFKIKNLVRKDTFKVYKNEEGLYFGQVTNASKNGKGLMISEKLIFEGDYKDNEKFYGCQKNIDGMYKGQFVKGVRSGYGKFQWHNGEVFEGEWKNGKKNGFGIWRSPKGDFYQGQWASNRQNGMGIFKHKVSTYKGQFSEFLKNGQGQQIFVNGDKFTGSYKQGKPNGFGKYLWANGSYYEGNFVRGVRQGQGVWKQINGTTYQGDFKNDFKNGYGKQSYTSGEIYQGFFIDGNKSSETNYDFTKL